MTQEGQPVPLDPDTAADRAFETALAAPPPGQQPDYPAPRKRRDPDFPFGKNADGTPVAPHGIGANGKPRQNMPGPGRAGKDKAADKARVQRQPAAKQAPEARADYTQDLVDFTDGLWMLMAGTPLPWARLAGFRTRIRCQAAILKENQAGIVSAANAGAVHNATIRAGVEAVCGGAASWVLPAMFMLVPFVAQSAAMWKAPVEGDVTELAKQTEADWQTFSEQQIRGMAAEARQLAELADRFEAEDLLERARAQAAT